MCDERQCKRQPNNDYCHCEDHYMQMSIADCAPRSNTGCTPYQLEALENMCKMSCKENPLEYLIRAEANERAQATEAGAKPKTALSTWYANKYNEEKIQKILKLVQSTQSEINETAIQEIIAWQISHGQEPDGKFGKKCFRAATGNKKAAANTQTKVISEQENNALYENLDDAEKMKRVDALPKQKVRTSNKLDLDKALEFYQKNSEIVKFLNEDPQAKAHHFDGISLDESQKERSKVAILNIQKWQSETRGLKADGAFGRSCLMVFNPQKFEEIFGFQKDGKNNYVNTNVDNIQPSAKDSHYDQIVQNSSLSHFQKEMLNVLTVDGTAKHFGDLTGDHGLAFGILHFTHKNEFENYLRLFYGSGTKDVSQTELVLFRKQVLEPAQCGDYEKAREYFGLNGNDDLWIKDKYYAYLEKTAKMELLIKLLRSDIGKRLQLELATRTMNNKIQTNKSKFNLSEGMTVGTAAMCAAFGNSSSACFDDIKSDELAEQQTQAGKAYLAGSAQKKEHKEDYKKNAEANWSSAMESLNKTNTHSIHLKGELKKASHRYKRMLLLIERFGSTWKDPFVEEKVPTPHEHNPAAADVSETSANSTRMDQTSETLANSQESSTQTRTPTNLTNMALSVDDNQSTNRLSDSEAEFQQNQLSENLKTQDQSDAAKTNDDQKYTDLGLSPYTEENYHATIKNFGSAADKGKTIAQLIIWSKERQDPSLLFAIYQGGVYRDQEGGNPKEKNKMKTTLQGDALYQAFKTGDVNAMQKLYSELASAHELLKIYGMQCNDITKQMVDTALGTESDASQFIGSGFYGSMFIPDADQDAGLHKDDGKKLSVDLKKDSEGQFVGAYLNRCEVSAVEKTPKKDQPAHTVDGQQEHSKLTKYVRHTNKLEEHRENLHGKQASGWNDVKAGDFVLQFQRDDDVKLNKKTGRLDMNSSFLENQFRHVEMILRVARVQEIFKDINDLKKHQATIVGGIGKTKKFWDRNPRLACTMGASDSGGVGVRNKDWKAQDNDNLDIQNAGAVLWHNLDDDWVEKGIVRTGGAGRKIYLWKAQGDK